MRRTVVAADDDSATLDLFELVLLDQGYCLQRHPLGELNVTQIEQDDPEFLILELAPFHAEATLVLLAKLRSCLSTKALPVIISSTDYQLLHQLERPLYNLGCATLKKPFNLDTFLAMINQAASSGGFERGFEGF